MLNIPMLGMPSDQDISFREHRNELWVNTFGRAIQTSAAVITTEHVQTIINFQCQQKKTWTPHKEYLKVQD